MDFAIDGISVGLLIVGLVEAAKEFGINGKGSRALALGLGVLFGGLAFAVSQNMIPAEAMPWVALVVTAIASGLSAMGYYDLLRKTFRND